MWKIQDVDKLEKWAQVNLLRFTSGRREKSKGCEEGKKLLVQLCEEKLRQRSEQLPRLREALREDVRALGTFQKNKKLSSSQACGAQKHLDVAFARKTVEVQEKLQAATHAQVRRSDVLLHQVRERSRVRDELQRRLQQLQDAAREDKWHQKQVQSLHHLGEQLEKVHSEVAAAQEMTTRYLSVRDALKKELAHLPLHLDLLCEVDKLYWGELQDLELTELEARRAADIAKGNLADLEAWLLAESELRNRSLAAQKVPVSKEWLKEGREKQQTRLAMGFPTLPAQDLLEAAKLEAIKIQKERQARCTEKMERAKAALQCSRLWDIPSELLARQKSSEDPEHSIKELKRKQQKLEETVRELELRKAELMFGQPPDTIGCRGLEEELRRNLQQEEARLEQMQARLLRDQEVRLQFESSADSLLARLRGITVPGQDSLAKAMGVEEKLQHTGQKLKHLGQQVAALPPQIPDEDSKTFRKVRSWLENAAANDPANRKVLLEDTVSRVQDPTDSVEDPDSDLVLSREAIKKQGLKLMERKIKSSKK
ncbi:PREDICTED: coiled-coil domain-containing protein 183 [Chaetura pelagica]|uniref:coiled-coil domain-containing protein 183 n=1 Tax=Chaetura pelagica TaxID=8897 RepID=UPI0005236498|nr:PREDICTED: coiled-coil domain-containing protein 183 [Chaetura pelagica]